MKITTTKKKVSKEIVDTVTITLSRAEARDIYDALPWNFKTQDFLKALEEAGVEGDEWA